MKRTIYDKLQEWKTKSNGSTALLIDGARRIGKSNVVQRSMETAPGTVTITPARK